MKIYLVTHGYCDDYRVVSVWSTRELAEAHNKWLKSQRFIDSRSLEIEDWDLDDSEILAQINFGKEVQ